MKNKTQVTKTNAVAITGTITHKLNLITRLRYSPQESFSTQYLIRNDKCNRSRGDLKRTVFKESI